MNDAPTPDPNDLASYRFYPRLPFDAPDLVRVRITYRDVQADVLYYDTDKGVSNLANLAGSMERVAQVFAKDYVIQKEVAKERLKMDQELSELLEDQGGKGSE